MEGRGFGVPELVLCRLGLSTGLIVTNKSVSREAADRLVVCDKRLDSDPGSWRKSSACVVKGTLQRTSFAFFKAHQL
jgi:hypothetical protein